MTTTFLEHVRSRLALHELRDGQGHPLLILHGLGERSPSAAPEVVQGWRGPIFALDFTGHGASSVPVGGGYTCEALMSDADAVLAELGPVTLLGYGLGGYVGLLLFGSRPTEIKGLVIEDGPGLDGGGGRPTSPRLLHVSASDLDGSTPDPWAMAELASDIRPPSYAADHVRQIEALSELELAVSVTSLGRPEWLTAILESPVVVESDATAALSTFASL
ncbi:MAG: alpha/beta hydrolase [Acidimicrobiaceae bacterium]|nr:alpha/beta hydrolase [Acidimicrobiaceae bacterium]